MRCTLQFNCLKKCGLAVSRSWLFHRLITFCAIYKEALTTQRM